MRADGYKDVAVKLATSDADLSQLIQFVRAFDPTAELRAAWGADYQARLDYLLTKAQDTYALGKEFPGSPTEVLLCMAHCVATAPYLGTPNASVESYLRNLLLELT